MTGNYAPVRVAGITPQLLDGELWVNVTITANERLERVGAQATATGDLPTDVVGNVTINHRDTMFLSGVAKGATVQVAPQIESHPGIERVGVILDDRETGPNATPTDTPDDCDQLWC